MKKSLSIIVLGTIFMLLLLNSSIPIVSANASSFTGDDFIFKQDLANGDSLQNKYSLENLANTSIPRVATWIAGFIAALAVIFLFVAAIQYLTAEGDPEKLTKAHKTVFWVLVGLALSMLAYAIIYLFLTVFTPAPITPDIASLPLPAAGSVPIPSDI